MATVTKWTPFGVALDITATAATVTRTSATQFTVKINASWETYYNGASTNYGMTATSGGASATINTFGKSASSGSGSFTGTYSISGNGSATKTISVTFRNFNNDNGDSATKAVSFNVTVPAWTSYKITFNANGGTNAPSAQTKWKNQALTLSATKPTRTGYSFLGWSTSSTATSATYSAGATIEASALNANTTLYAVWKANTYTVSYNANGGTGAPSNQTKTYGTTLTLSATKPTRANYNFKGWGTSASATSVAYAAGASYTANAAVTLYAIWELAYTNPRINGLFVTRSKSTGVADNNGTYAAVYFKYECDKALESIVIDWVSGTETGSKTVAATAISGTISVTIGNGTLNINKTYTVTVTVTDSNGYTALKRTLNGQRFPFRCLPENKGIAFGKAAELENTAEFAYDAKFNSPVYGKALGMDRLPEIPANSDFNDYLETGCFAVYRNDTSETIANIPVARAGRLEVWSATGEGVRLEQWSYLRQRYIPYNSGNAVWEREITRNEANVWTYYDWWQSSLTPAVAEKVYSKAAMTISLTANSVLGAVNTYTKIPFDKSVLSTNSRLTLSSNAIRIGSNIQHIKVSGQVLVSPAATDGLRHVRIQKVSGSTTTSIAWSTLYFTGSRHLMHILTPLIVSVKEGDLIQMVFYTGNASDSISSGTAANGYQTYLTIEEL